MISRRRKYKFERTGRGSTYEEEERRVRTVRDFRTGGERRGREGRE